MSKLILFSKYILFRIIQSTIIKTRFSISESKVISLCMVKSLVYIFADRHDRNLSALLQLHAYCVKKKINSKKSNHTVCLVTSQYSSQLLTNLSADVIPAVVSLLLIQKKRENWENTLRQLLLIISRVAYTHKVCFLWENLKIERERRLIRT